MAFMIGAINFLANAEDMQQLGPNFALALISILYATLVNIIIITPFSAYIKGKLEDIG
jgi:flagellar motor component MotA